MEQLKVRNFGAIKEADIDIKKYNILIGHTSSGKSIIAKLLSIFNNHSFWSTLDGDFTAFLRLLEKYNINFLAKNHVFYKNKDMEFFCCRGVLTVDFFRKVLKRRAGQKDKGTLPESFSTK